jgi:hypothetical protein
MNSNKFAANAADINMESGKWVSFMLVCNTCQVVLDVEHVFEASGFS